jgi:hypothetical protein
VIYASIILQSVNCNARYNSKANRATHGLQPFHLVLAQFINLLIILRSQGLTRITFPNRRHLQGSTGNQEMPVKHFRQYIIDRVSQKRECWPNYFPGLYRLYWIRIGTERQEHGRTITGLVPILDKDRCGRMPPKLPPREPVRTNKARFRPLPGRTVVNLEADNINPGPNCPKIYSDKMKSRLNSPLTDCIKRGTEYRLN